MTGRAPEGLAELARNAGIAPHWEDFRGHPREVSPDTLRRLLSALDLPCDNPGRIADSLARLADGAAGGAMPPLITATCGEAVALPTPAARVGTAYTVDLESGGRIDGRLLGEHGGTVLPALQEAGYHTLEFDGVRTTVAVAPRRCTSTRDLCHGRAARPWGLTAQLYGLRMPGDGGIGSYGALGHLATRLGRDGAAALAISPVHAMFSANPAHRSPYSPSSRLLLNTLHVDPSKAFGDAAIQAREALDPGAANARLEADALIDWPAAGGARLAQLRWLYGNALARDPALIADFECHRREEGVVLEDHARFEALHAHFLAQGMHGWRDWPPPYRHPRSPAVEDFARAHADEVRFHAFLQWLAARGLRGAQRDAIGSGMPIGLVADLAIGSDPGGSHVWSRQEETVVGMSIGAPPDELAMQGQNWGLATLSPTAMRGNGFSAFIELLRANMRYAGGIRIDHVMGLMRLWLVPEGASPLEGAYLSYPRQDLLRLIALESWRHRCLVVGEDLGTVPAGFRDVLSEAEVLGMSVLWFERSTGGAFPPPSHWRERAVAMTTTHDLPTTAGWWLGRDIEVRAGLGLFESDTELAAQRARRDMDRTALWGAIHGGSNEPPPQPADGATGEFVDAAVAHVGRTPAALALVPVEDILGLTEAPNVPGTLDEHPNWRRRLPADIDTLFDAPAARHRLQALDRSRADSAQAPDASGGSGEAP